jgi:hypothetical protein
MKKPTPQYLALVEPTIAEIVSRPSFRVAMRWIETSATARTKSTYPTSVGLICFVLEATWGAIVDRQTMALALEQCGFKIAARDFVGGNYELAVNIKRGSINQTPWRTEQPRPAAWAWAKDDAPAPGVNNLYKNLLVR